MAINLMCMNDKCKYYYEDNCMKNINEERLQLDETGKCTTFETGEYEGYGFIKSNKNKDLELLNRIAQGGNITSADIGEKYSNKN